MRLFLGFGTVSVLDKHSWLVSANDFLQTDRHEYEKVVDLIETVQMNRGWSVFYKLLWKP